jgi:hypothetical protein
MNEEIMVTIHNEIIFCHKKKEIRSIEITWMNLEGIKPCNKRKNYMPSLIGRM